MQMNMYDVSRVLILLSQNGFKDVFSEVVDAGGFISIFIFARKRAQPIGVRPEEHLWAVELGE